MILHFLKVFCYQNYYIHYSFKWNFVLSSYKIRYYSNTDNQPSHMHKNENSEELLCVYSIPRTLDII